MKPRWWHKAHVQSIVTKQECGCATNCFPEFSVRVDELVEIRMWLTTWTTACSSLWWRSTCDQAGRQRPSAQSTQMWVQSFLRLAKLPPRTLRVWWGQATAG